MTYSYSPTLSQTFDIGDFIEPDIVSVVDASVQRACAEALSQGNLESDLVRTFYVLPSSLPEAVFIPEGSVPPSDPDVFIPYDQPDVPVIPDFVRAEHEAVSDLPDAPVFQGYETERREKITDAPGVPVIPDFVRAEHEAVSELPDAPVFQDYETERREKVTDAPGMPVIPDFDRTEHEIIPDMPDASVIPELNIIDQETEPETDAPDIPDFDIAEHEAEAEAPEIEADLPETIIDAPEIEAEEPLAEAAVYTADPVERQIFVDIPDVPGVSEGIEQVRRDLIRYDKEVRGKIRIAITFAIIAIVNFLLLYYFLHN